MSPMIDLRRDRRGHRRRVARRAEGDDVVLAVGQRLDPCRCAIETRFRFELPFSAETTRSDRTVGRPDDRLAVLRRAAPPGRRRCRRRCRSRSRRSGCFGVLPGRRRSTTTEIGLAVGADRHRRAAIPTNAMRRPSGDTDERCRSTPSIAAIFAIAPPRGRHRVELGAFRVEVRLGHARRDEVDLRTVRRPLDVRPRLNSPSVTCVRRWRVRTGRRRADPGRKVKMCVRRSLST